METMYEILNPFVTILVDILKNDLKQIRRDNEYFIPDIHIHIVKDYLNQTNVKIYLHIDYLGIYPYVLLEQLINVTSLTEITNFVYNFNNNINNKKIEYKNKINTHYYNVIQNVEKKSMYRNNSKIEMLNTEEEPLIQASKSIIACLDDEYIRYKIKNNLESIKI